MGQSSTRRQLVVGGGSLILNSIALRAAAGPTDPLAQVRRIGLIVALGDRAEIAREGMTIFDGKLGYLPTDSWNLDELATRKAADLLAPRFEVVTTSFDRSSFLASGPDGPRSDNPKLTPLIQALPASVDAYLVIRRSPWVIAYYPRVEVYGGLGALGSTLAGLLGKHGMAYVNLEVAMVQAGTGKTLKFQRSVLVTENEDHGDWADTADKMTDVQVQKLHERIELVTAKAVTQALTSMKLAAPT